MSVTKANKLSENTYLHLLDVAKTLREVYLRMSKSKCYRVYTEARKNGLRSKMCTNKVDLKSIAKLNSIVEALYPHLDIKVEKNTSMRPWNYDDVCIFVKVKK